MRIPIAVARWLALLLLLIAAVQGRAAAPPTSIRVVLDDNYPPYIFADGNGRAQGIRKDLWDLWQQRTGIAVDFQPMDWGKARAIMESGEADVIDTIFDTEERRRIYDFSRPYATIDVPIFFDKSIGGITDASSLKGFLVGVKDGDACIDYLKAHGVTNLKRYPSYEAEVKAAVRHEIRVLCIDKPAAIYFFNREAAAEEFRYTPPLYVGEFHWAVAKGRTELRHLVEDGFSRITADERAAIDARWQGESLAGGLWPGVARYGGYVLLAVVLVILVLSAWSWSLRRRVAARTSELGKVNGSLRESEARFRSLTELSSDWYWETDAEYRFVKFSDSEREGKWDNSQLRALGVRRWELPGIVPISGTWLEHKATLAARKPFRDFEYQHNLEDGSVRYVTTSGEPVFDAGGCFTGYRGIASDITARKDAEHRIVRLSRVHAVLSGINALIVRVSERDELLRAACLIAVEQGGFLMAWIGLVDRNAMELVPVAVAGTTTDPAALAKHRFSLLAGDPPGHTFSARAIREQKPVFTNDVPNDPAAVFKEEHAQRGSRSMAILPMLIAGESVGVLALYAAEVNFFDADELTLLTELASDISFAIDHIEKAAKLNYLAYHDELTGLANRSLFLDRVTQHIRAAIAGGHKLAVFLVDLERFKNINDSLGREAGDALLRQVAEWLTRNTAGDANLVARVGADHFAVVMPEVKQEGTLVRLLEKWFEAFLNQPFRLNDAVFRISHKVGVALFPDDGADAETLFRNAEAALKAAKASGERYVFYKPKMTDAVAGKLTLESQLRQALDNNEFVLHYQPKVSLAGGRLVGAEALIRWNDPRTGLVPPGRFIPILEETGLIQDVGRWALRQAIADYLRWRAAGLPAVRIAVNVSPLQLRNHSFIDEIGQVIGIDPQAAAGLELEITESLIMEDVKHNIASLRAIRDMGIRIAIDDFGTGFSSLAYLARLPVDTLKIDRSFVVDMTAGPQGLALVSTIIKLAHSLKLKVVAEGVETEEQRRLLHLLDCDEMQGFLFSKPLPGDVFEGRFLALPGATAPALIGA